jgi:hypothetical protein
LAVRAVEDGAGAELAAKVDFLVSVLVSANDQQKAHIMACEMRLNEVALSSKLMAGWAPRCHVDDCASTLFETPFEALARIELLWETCLFGETYRGRGEKSLGVEMPYNWLAHPPKGHHSGNRCEQNQFISTHSSAIGTNDPGLKE